ncbi:hypothetical protein P9K38_20870 [Pseudomonas sp. 905_Psudmo1]|nr:hypothetical protein [Pseudomonas sp. 905_Psudmo1]WFS17870.1 hypothetical protein P9K38_20870 [Pseudomonas sp. 905_Psudmo1]
MTVMAVKAGNTIFKEVGIIMKGLKVEIWEQWEELCCYFMEKIAKSKGHSVTYQTYGSKGQSQFGIDLVPVNSDLALVGQCKMRETSFTWDNVLAEVAKTDLYPGAINCYVLFTTANKHTTIQDVQNSSTVYRHTRPNGTTFPVYVKHWADYEMNDLDFIPTHVLRRIFPNAFDLVAVAQPPSIEGYIASLKVLQSYVPSRITLADLNWLETYNFSEGWMPERAFDPFLYLYHDLQRVEDAMRHGITSWLHTTGYPEIKASLLAGKDFYLALKEFVDSVRAHIVGSRAQDGTSILTVRDLRHWQRLARQYGNNAQYLAQVYRRSVLGEPAQ